MTVDYKKLWEDALVEIELNVSRPNFATWFQNVTIDSENNGTIFLNVPNTFVEEWLSKKYYNLVLRAIQNLHSSARNIEYIICCPDDPKSGKNKAQTAHSVSEQLQQENQPAFSEFCTDKKANLNPKYTFDSFIVGSFNEVAYAAALAVTKNLGTAYSPLFIYGGVGLGKTHLLQAIGNKIRETTPDSRVFYLTSEKFANDFVASMRNNTIPTFKEKYRKYDLLIIDDIQFFSGKLKIQEEFFHIFNSLHDKNSQIIFSSDQPPKHITGLEERLRSRFEGGMMVDISRPEYESRLAILKTKIEERGISLDQEVLEYVASAISDNIRELEGSLNSIVGQSKIRNRILSLPEIKELLKKNIKPLKQLTISQVVKIITDFYNIDEQIIYEKTRKREVVKPRQVAMYLLREDLSASFPHIGKKFGHRDHTTVLHAHKKISASLKNDERLNQEIGEIRELLYKV